MGKEASSHVPSIFLSPFFVQPTGGLLSTIEQQIVFCFSTEKNDHLLLYNLILLQDNEENTSLNKFVDTEKCFGFHKLHKIKCLDNVRFK